MMTKPDDEILSEASEREGYTHQKALIEIVVPLVGESLRHPPQMMLGYASTWKIKKVI